jgi:hypothetical protein
MLFGIQNREQLLIFHQYRFWKKKLEQSLKIELIDTTKIRKNVLRFIKNLLLDLSLGDVAQLARVLDWQSRGRGFEPHLLHLVKTH